MWKAKKGMTTFSFDIPVETSQENHDLEYIKTDVLSEQALPSSYWNANYGGVRYVLAAYVYSIN
jgi:hypothetical protein